jgi:hypothetical protein
MRKETLFTIIVLMEQDIIYNVSIYKVYKNGFVMLSNRYYKSNKELNIKDIQIIKKFKNFLIIRYIDKL